MPNLFEGFGSFSNRLAAKSVKKSLKIPALVFGSKLRFSLFLRQIFEPDVLVDSPNEFIVFHSSFGLPMLSFILVSIKRYRLFCN